MGDVISLYIFVYFSNLVPIYVTYVPQTVAVEIFHDFSCVRP